MFTQSQAVAKAKEIEENYGVRVSVIKRNPDNERIFPTGFPASVDYGIFIIEPHSDKVRKFKLIEQELTKRDFLFQANFSLQPLPNVEDLIGFAKKNPHFLKQWLAMQGVLAEYLFHHEVYGDYNLEIRSKLMKVFPQIPKLIQERIERITKFDEKQRIRSIVFTKKLSENSRKLLGAREKRDMIDRLEAMAKRIAQNPGNIIIGLDRSGRPVALMLRIILKKVYNTDLPIYFVDPTMIKHADRITEQHRIQFSKEYPTLVEMLPNSIPILIDDQIWQGNSLQKMRDLLTSFGSEEPIKEFLSGYPQELPPSWRTQNILGIRTLKNRFKTVRTPETTEQRKRRKNFEAHLNWTANRVVRNLKPR